MGCCDGGCPLYDEQFDERTARAELKAYRRKGPVRTTRLLIDALAVGGAEGLTVLDIGGGVGAVHHELLRAGAAAATDVEASGPYLAAARSEAERLGHAERVQYERGDFVALAERLEPADLVALDRVVCCYGDWAALVGRSAALARRRYGLVYPRDTWWTRLAGRALNVWCRVRRTAFRTFIHRARDIDAAVRAAGLLPAFRRVGLFWQVVVWERPLATPADVSGPGSR